MRCFRLVLLSLTEQRGLGVRPAPQIRRNSNSIGTDTHYQIGFQGYVSAEYLGRKASLGEGDEDTFAIAPCIRIMPNGVILDYRISVPLAFYSSLGGVACVLIWGSYRAVSAPMYTSLLVNA